MLYLLADEEAAFQEAQTALLADLRFEHLDKTIDDVVWHFLCECALDRTGDRVPAFVEAHAREPEERSCFFPIELLKVQERVEAVGLTLLPTDDAEVPAPHWAFSVAPPVGSVALESLTGTHLGRMAERGRQAVRHKLRLLRIILRQHRGIPDRQLRFRLGPAYSFGGRLSGWEMEAEKGWELSLDGELLDVAGSQPALAAVPLAPANDLERRVNLAADWIEASFFATRQVMALLYLFFALEALLGDKSEGLKAHALAFRRALLGIATEGRFSDPSRAYLLYDEVRSAAVHGEDPPAVDRDTFQNFASDVRRALREYIEFAEKHSLRRRSRVLQALESLPDRQRLVEWLRENGDPSWQKYLDRDNK